MGLWARDRASTSLAGRRRSLRADACDRAPVQPQSVRRRASSFVTEVHCLGRRLSDEASNPPPRAGLLRSGTSKFGHTHVGRGVLAPTGNANIDALRAIRFPPRPSSTRPTAPLRNPIRKSPASSRSAVRFVGRRSREHLARRTQRIALRRCVRIARLSKRSRAGGEPYRCRGDSSPRRRLSDGASNPPRRVRAKPRVEPELFPDRSEVAASTRVGRARSRTDRNRFASRPAPTWGDNVRAQALARSSPTTAP